MTTATTTAQTLSFDGDLRHACAPIQTRLQCGAKSLDGMLNIISMRIDAETTFTNALQKMMNTSSSLLSSVPSGESLRRHGLNSMYTDLKNEYVSHMEFLDSLRKDVQCPLISTQRTYLAQNKASALDIKQSVQTLRKQQSEVTKLKGKYDKLVNASTPSASTSTKAKHKHLQQLLAAKKKLIAQQKAWRTQNVSFQARMTKSLRSMESAETARMDSVRDALTNWAAFVTSMSMNRSYDIRTLAQSVSEVNVETDLQSFMRSTLTKYPALEPSPRSVSTSMYRKISVNIKMPNDSQKVEFQFDPMVDRDLNAFVRSMVDSIGLDQEREGEIFSAIQSKLQDFDAMSPRSPVTPDGYAPRRRRQSVPMAVRMRV